MSSFSFADRMSEKTANPLEQFVLLAKTAKVTSFASFKVLFIKKILQGAAAVELIKQALEAPGVFVFGELLDMSNVQVGPSVSCTHESFSLFRTWKMDPTLPT